MFQLIAYGHAECSFYGLELDKFERKDLRACGWTDNQAKKLLDQMKGGQMPKKETRNDCFKSAEMTLRNQTVERFLTEDFISTVSDRADDQRVVNGERVTLHFLDRSVEATYQLLFDYTGIRISQSLFRKVLTLCKHVKQGGKRQRRTAQCSKCSQRSFFEQGLEICGPIELQEKLQSPDVPLFVQLAYCEQQEEDCLLNRCGTCGGANAYPYFAGRLGELSDEALETPIGFQLWEKDQGGAYTAAKHVEPLSDVLPRIVEWIKKEKIGLHERQVKFQSAQIRDVKSWDYELNEPHSSLTEHDLCLKWDHAMRPLMTNNRELQAAHWLTNGIPLMGFIAIYRENREGHALQGKLMKRHVFFTAPTESKDNWHFTVLALGKVLDYLLPLIGRRRQLIFIADGSTKQVLIYFKFLYFFLTFSKNWNTSVWQGMIDVISDMKAHNPLASEITSVSLHRNAAQHGKG